MSKVIIVRHIFTDETWKLARKKYSEKELRIMLEEVGRCETLELISEADEEQSEGE